MTNLKLIRSITGFILLSACNCCWGLPGYHIDSDQSAEKAVREFANNSFKFKTVVYQASLDKNRWRLALAAYHYLQQEPKNPERQCSFALAYFSTRNFDFRESEKVPQEDAKVLDNLYDEAIQASKDAVSLAPNSMEPHLNYGQFLQSCMLMDKKNIPIMIHEYQKAVELRPDLGETHYYLANGYAGSGDYSTETLDRIILEAKKAISLDPRLTQSYNLLAMVYNMKHDYVRTRLYLTKYIQAHPEQSSRPDIVAWFKEFDNLKAGH